MARISGQFLAGVVLALAAVLAWPLTPWKQAETYRIAITATGGKDPRSRGSEVWLTGLPAGMDFQSLLDSAAAGWEMRDGVLVSYRDQPSTLRFEGPLDAGGGLVLVRHPWSGEVRIEINGEARTENLFDPAPNAQPLTLALASFPKAAGMTTGRWASFIGATVLAGIAIVLALSALRRLPVASARESRFSYAADTGRHALPALAIFLLVLLGTWPGQMSSDSVSQWWQFASGVFGNGHPLLHTMLIVGPGYLLGSPGWSILLQIVLLAFVCGALAAEIRRWNVSAAAVWAVSIVVPLLPGVHLSATVLWKDIPYATAVAALTVMTMALVRTDGALARRPSYLLGFAIVLFLVATLRHNGILVAAGDLALIGVLMRGRIGKRLPAVALAAGVALPLVWTAFLVPALGVSGLGRHYSGIVPLHLLGGMVAADVVEDKATLARLDAILPLADWRSSYDCLNVVPLFWAPGIDYGKIDASLFAPAIEAVAAAPAIALKHFLCVNASVWRLSPTEGAEYTLVPLGIWKAGPPMDSLGLKEAPVIGALDSALKAEFAATTGSTRAFVLFWRPAFMFLMLGLCLVFALSRNRQAGRPLLIACAPVVLNTLSMMPLTGSQDFRYQLPIYLIGPFLMAAAVAAGQARSRPAPSVGYGLGQA